MRNPFQKFIHSHAFTFRLYWFLSGCILLSAAGWFFNTFPPEEGRFTILIGLVLLTGIVWSFLFSFFQNVRRVIRVTLLISGILLLRSSKLFEPIYYLIFIAFIITLNAALKKNE